MKKNHYFVLFKGNRYNGAGALCSRCNMQGHRLPKGWRVSKRPRHNNFIFYDTRTGARQRCRTPSFQLPNPLRQTPVTRMGAKITLIILALPQTTQIPASNNPGGDEPPAENNTPLTPHPVDRSYFDDALFVGDSRTLGMSQYGGLDNATFFADVGLTVFNAFDVSLNAGNYGSVTLSQLLSSGNFTKVYLMLGINELGYPFLKV